MTKRPVEPGGIPKIKFITEEADGTQEVYEVEAIMAAFIRDAAADAPEAHQLIWGTLSERTMIRAIAAVAAPLVESMRARGATPEQIERSFDAIRYSAMALALRKEAESDPRPDPWIRHLLPEPY